MVTTMQGGSAKLEELPDREFRELVDRELRKEHPHSDRDVAERCRRNRCRSCQQIAAISPQLREPEVVGRWITLLEMMKASSETQLGAKRDELLKKHESMIHDEWLELKREFQGWRAGNVRFLNSVTSRLLEAREIRRRYFGAEYPTRAIEERNLASKNYLRLLSAITDHRNTVGDEYEATEADQALWATITTEP